MPPPLVVPDASVLLKWVLPAQGEPDVDRAIRLRDAIVDETVAGLLPTLWLYEVGNTVARRFPDHASRWLAALRAFSIEEYPSSDVWLAQTLELTKRHDVSFYDAAYHAVALIQGGVFVTADARYARRVEKSGGVIELSDWQPP